MGTVPVYRDMLGFLDGPAEVVLIATGFSHPVASATEKRLISLLYQRATAHRL